MLGIPDVILTEYVAHLKIRNIPTTRHAEYRKWLRYYLDFCDKYQVPTRKSELVRLSCDKFKEKKHSEGQWERAARAVSLYYEILYNKSSSPEEEIEGVGTGAHSLLLGWWVIKTFLMAMR